MINIETLEVLIKVAHIAQQSGALTLKDAAVVANAVEDAEKIIQLLSTPCKNVDTIDEVSDSINEDTPTINHDR